MSVAQGESRGATQDHITGKFYDMQLVKRVLPFIHPFRYHLVVCIAMLFVVMALELAGPLIVKAMIDHAIGGGHLELVGRYAAYYLAVLMGVFVFQFAQQYLMQWIGQRVIFTLRQTLFRHLQSLSLKFFNQRPVGTLMTRVMYDVENINALFTDGIVNILGDLVIVFGVMGIMLALDWRIALLTFVTLPLVLFASLMFRKYTIESYRKIRTYSARINAQLQEAITGMSTIQAFGQEPRIFEKFDVQNKLYRNETYRVIFYHAVFNPTITVITGLAHALIIWQGGPRIAAGIMTVGIVAAFFQYVERLFNPIRDLAEKYNLIQQAMTSAERIFQLLDIHERIAEPVHPAPFPTASHAVEFRHVWMRYDEGAPWALEDVSFKVGAGERIAFVGHTGAGKTSLMSALARLYEFQRGEIMIGGVDLRNFRLQDLRSSVGMVLQEPFMFSGTLLDNIRLGHQEIAEARVREVCEQLGIEAWIQSLGRGYHETLRERGSNLSTGQKQLLACARILVLDPKILVLDEATSSMDPQTEWLVRAALRKIMEGRTTLLIAHRLATVQDVERVVVLHHGKVVESGTHRQLMKHNGHYAMLYRLQSVSSDAVH